ncbi:hypothetical protein J635_0281 [Acinetobacter baumannii 233846]|nr:hypothetical protein J635_0281 [Acinetobacter baumannii 233846]
MAKEYGRLIQLVHGGIRHLEKLRKNSEARARVHGGIRHLETSMCLRSGQKLVHGGIRHLEIIDGFN